MFTGIVQGLARIEAAMETTAGLSLQVGFPNTALRGICTGASIAIDGVCLSVRKTDGNTVDFDVINETLQRTNLKRLASGALVNFERAARLGDEVGGHLVSGHIYTEVQVSDVSRLASDYHVVSLKCPPEAMPYMFTKGFIALNGCSLTLVGVQEEVITVHLIPETLATTSWRHKRVDDWINLEIDATTQAVVETTRNYLAATKKHVRV